MTNSPAEQHFTDNELAVLLKLCQYEYQFALDTLAQYGGLNGHEVHARVDNVVHTIAERLHGMYNDIVIVNRLLHYRSTKHLAFGSFETGHLKKMSRRYQEMFMDIDNITWTSENAGIPVDEIIYLQIKLTSFVNY